MKKINWFSRLFMSWNTIINYILNNKEIDVVESTHKEEIASLTQKNKSLNERFEDLRSTNNDNKKYLDEEKRRNIKLETKIAEIESSNKLANTYNEELKNKSIIKDNDIKTLTQKIMENKQEYENLHKKIYEKLNPLKRIQKTFFGETGNKGKAELGERQIKFILQSSGLPDDFWKENLIVGKNQVEFAIKSGENNKWVPVDSKVLDAEVNNVNEVIIDSKYKSKVLTQAKEITKYLDKDNTTAYGLLVLQSDAIYIKLFEKFPLFFQEIINKYKIHICSPASFIQLAWSISYILEIYEKVHNDEKIYDQMLDALKTITKLSTSLLHVHKNFNIAMDTHYPTLRKRQHVLINKLVKDGKIKELSSIKMLEIDED